MAHFNNPLSHVQVAAPCKADWDQMIGDDRVRFCNQCDLNVFNLSGMTRSEAESLIARTEGRLCVKFYRRFDGSIITKDCPVGWRAIRRRASYLTKAITSTVLGFFAGVGVHSALSSIAESRLERTMGVLAVNSELMGAIRIDDLTPEVGQAIIKVDRRHTAPSHNKMMTSAR